VYVYRDTGEEPGDPAASPASDPAEHDAAYWYDLVMKDTAPKREESRGPFEPLVSSSGSPPDEALQRPATSDAAVTAEPTGTEPGQTSPDTVRDESPDDTARARARKLEQIKDFYLTAEAIGEQNVDKHFDQLLAQQRELISDYFRQSAAAGPAVTAPRDDLAAETGAPQHDLRGPSAQEGPGAAGGQAGAPEGAGVAAEQPRAW